MKIVFATHNDNKLKEVQDILLNSIELLSLDDISCYEDIPETADTVEGNALIKANHVFENYNYPCFADDTGLFVEALNGEPGVHSARYAGYRKDPDANNEKLLQNLTSVDNRNAFFKTVIVYKTETATEEFSGICRGKILKSSRGQIGFGYDPIFLPEGYKQSFAEMSPKTKNKISHRAKAMEKFLSYLLEK